MDHIWQGWNTPQIIAWYSTTPRTCSAVNLAFRKQSLDNVPHQWYNGPRKIIYVWICYLTDLSLLFQAWITSFLSDHNMSFYYNPKMLICYLAFYKEDHEHVPHQWWSDPRMMTYMYGYASLLFYERYIRYGSHLTWVNHPPTTAWPSTTPRACSTVTMGSENKEPGQCTSSVV